VQNGYQSIVSIQYDEIRLMTLHSDVKTAIEMKQHSAGDHTKTTGEDLVSIWQNQTMSHFIQMSRRH